MNNNRISSSRKVDTRVKEALKSLNLTWIHILSTIGIFPVTVDFKAHGIKGTGGLKKILLCLHLLSVQAQILYYMKITVDRAITAPTRAALAFSFDYVLIVPSQVSIFVAISYFILSRQSTDSMFNDAMHYFQVQLSARHTFIRSRTLLEIFTMFIPFSYVTFSTVVIFAANMLLPPHSGTFNHRILVSGWQGISVATWLAWCYFGTLLHLLVLERIDKTLGTLRVATL